MAFPKKYEWLTMEKEPKMLRQMLRIYGTLEFMGAPSNPLIIQWASELGIRKVYSNDAIPWCGLAMAIVAKRAGYEPPKGFLSALAWAKFGQPAKGGPMLGDVLVYARRGGGHVTMYVGEDDKNYHCMGGNQQDAVSIVLKPKSTLVAARRANFKIGQPKGVRKIVLLASGTPASTKES